MGDDDRFPPFVPAKPKPRSSEPMEPTPMAGPQQTIINNTVNKLAAMQNQDRMAVVQKGDPGEHPLDGGNGTVESTYVAPKRGQPRNPGYYDSRIEQAFALILEVVHEADKRAIEQIITKLKFE